MTEKNVSIKKILIILSLCVVAALCAVMVTFGVKAEEQPVTEVYIDIDFGDYDGRNDGVNLPHGKTDKSYPVFECSAIDNNGNAAERVLVTVTDPSGKLVPQIKGRFVTAEEGTYTIKYVAVSGAVNAEKTIQIKVDKYVDDIVYTAENENVPETGVTGSAVFVVLGEFSGGVGDLTSYLTLKCGDEEQEMVETGAGIYFIPEKSGTYTIEYGVRDFIEDKKSVVKTVTVTDSETPVLDVPFVPASAIAGETLVLPHVNGVIYKNGKKYYLPVKVTFDGTDVSDSLKVDNLTVGEHVIEYACASPYDGVKEVKSLTVKDKTVEYDVARFVDDFVLGGCVQNTKVKNAYSVLIEAKKDETVNATISYKKELTDDRLDMEIKATCEEESYSKIYFVITDAQNANKYVKADVSKFFVNGTAYAGYSYDGKSNAFKIVNKNNSKDEGITIGKYANGETFNGFESGTAYVSMEFEGVVKDIEVIVNKVGSTVVNGARIYDKYFDFVNCSPSTSAKNEYTVSVNAKDDGTASDASLSFSRSLSIGFINIELGANAKFGAYSEAYLVITDSKNAAEKIKVKIYAFTSYDKIWFSYDDETKSVVNKLNGSVIESIKTYADGTKFNGFGSGKAYVSFEFKDVVKDVVLVVTKVGSTTVTTGNVDFTPPVIEKTADFRAVYVSSLGNKVNLPKLTAFDLLDKNVTVTLTVVKPDGTLVYKGNEGYTLEVTESGEYSVEYTATDSAGNIRRLVSSVYVTDIVSPVIEVNGIAASVKVGDEITLPKATITDNDTAADKILSYVYVVKGNNRKQIVGDTYKFTAAGVYKIRYVAYDANQNFTIVEFTVECK